jgi:thiamine kinase-like enzyme
MTQSIELLIPPADVPEIQRGNWYPLPLTDPVVSFLAAELWEDPIDAPSWEVARLSKAAYVYKENKTNWKTVAKFYSVKSKSGAEKYAQREFIQTQDAQVATSSPGQFRAVRPLAVYQGTIFVEYVDGLTLEDVIAVRRSRPGTLLPSLEKIARFFAQLHTNASRPNEPIHFDWEINDTWEILDNLVKHGILEADPLVENGVKVLVERWAEAPRMRAYTPVLIHGDATTSNFIFTWEDEMVAVDWERARPADPASDLGRLMAEVSHSISQHGGSPAEALPFVEHLVATYRQNLPQNWEVEALLKRARYFQAMSTLRIARNGWIPRLYRTGLVAQAMSLLAQYI